MVSSRIVDAVEALDPQPRVRRWTSLSYCVLDSVWSLGALYDSVVCPLVFNVAKANGDLEPVISLPAGLPSDPLPLVALMSRYPTVDSLLEITNMQRTSTRAGITKAEAVLRYADILIEHKVADLRQAEGLLAGDEGRWGAVNRDLMSVPGEGAWGIRRGYLWMLCGHDDIIKPDRMVLRWLARYNGHADGKTARVILAEVAQQLSQRQARPVTSWMVDHAIWKAERSRHARRPKY